MLIVFCGSGAGFSFIGGVGGLGVGFSSGGTGLDGNGCGLIGFVVVS